MMRRGGNRNAPVKTTVGHGRNKMVPAMGNPTPGQMPLSKPTMPTMSGPLGGVGTPPAGNPTPMSGPSTGGEMTGRPSALPAGNPGFPSPTGMKKGGKVKAKSSYKSGGSVSSASKRADGCCVKGKTKGKMI